MNDSGYGVLWHGSYKNGGKQYRAHRVSYYLHYGRWPEPEALHTCDHPACVRPDHLVEGTQQDNLVDMHQNGRHRYGIVRGEENGMTKLNRSLVNQIRAEYATGKVSQQALADRHGVGQSTISSIVRGETWSGDR